jgi:DNA-binding NtrC family response regulator
LNVVPLTVPPLRQRPEDIPLLVAYFVARFAKRFGRKFDGVSRSTMDTLVAYPWHGNIRELQNVIERAVVLSNGPMLTIDPDMLAIVEEPRRPTNAAAMPDASATETGGRRSCHSRTPSDSTSPGCCGRPEASSKDQPAPRKS